MRHEPALAMREQSEDALASKTMQLRPATQADADMSAWVNGKADAASVPIQRASGWARRITAELGSVLLDTLGLAATIEWHLHRWQKCTGILYKLAVNNASGFDLPEEYAATIFEIYSEALSNVVRHADASRVAIALTITPREATLVLRDNGIGLGEEASRLTGGGIAGMQARAQRHKGLCELAGARNAGTTVTVNLPIAGAP